MPYRRPHFTREELLVDVADRLRSVCRSMPPAEFEALVARIVEVELKYRGARESDLAAFREPPPPRPDGEPPAG